MSSSDSDYQEFAPPGLSKMQSTPISDKFVSVMSPATLGARFDPNMNQSTFNNPHFEAENYFESYFN